MRKRDFTVLFYLLFGAFSTFAFPQEEKQDSIQKQLDELRQKLEDEKKKSEQEIADLWQQISDLEERAAQAQGSQQTANVFNPAITFFGNFVGRLDDQPVLNEEGEAVDDRFNLREVELDFRAPIDPWADGVAIITMESEVPNEFAAEVEEGYLILKKFPGLDAAPLGTKIKIGRFRPEFGRFNRIHTHDLPQITRPRSYQTFLGEEGYIQNGVGAQFFLPTPGDNNSLEATFQLLNGGNLPVAEENSNEDPAFLGNLKWFWELAEEHNLEVGTSVLHGKFDLDGHRNSDLYGVDFTYKWKPFAAGEWQSFLLGGELYSAAIERDTSGDENPWGFFVWSQYQFNRNFYAGVILDRSEELDDVTMQTYTTGAFLTYYTSEFLRMRTGVEHANSDIPEEDNRNSLFLEINFVFGSHPVEPYWVNR